MALQSCLVALAALLVCGATARPQRVAVFEPIIFNNESAALPPPSALPPRFKMKTRGACSSGPVYAPPCSDAFPLTTLEADSVVQFIVPGSPLKLTPFAYCGWEFQGPTDGQLYITCETASFFIGQYFLVWEKDSVTGVHNQQNVNIKYQFSGSSGRVGVRTLSKSFYAAVRCDVTFIVAPASTEAGPAAIEVTLAATEAAPATTEAGPAATEAASSTTEAASSTTEAASSTTEAGPAATETAPSGTDAAPATTEAGPAETEAATSGTDATPATTEAVP